MLIFQQTQNIVKWQPPKGYYGPSTPQKYCPPFSFVLLLPPCKAGSRSMVSCYLKFVHIGMCPYFVLFCHGLRCHGSQKVAKQGHSWYAQISVNTALCKSKDHLYVCVCTYTYTYILYTHPHMHEVFSGTVCLYQSILQ